jgi:predicted regulator of Ras-like GTPase activity (Roadblock/LC7/MglB family)
MIARLRDLAAYPPIEASVVSVDGLTMASALPPQVKRTAAAMSAAMLSRRADRQ